MNSRNCAKFFTYIILLILTATLWAQYCDSPYSSDKEIETQGKMSFLISHYQ